MQREGIHVQKMVEIRYGGSQRALLSKKRRKLLTRTKAREVACVVEGPMATPMSQEKERIDGGYAANVY
jgi:hypothetical protein